MSAMLSDPTPTNPAGVSYEALEGVMVSSERARDPAFPPCTVSVEWVSVTYVAGDIGNDWVFNASANGTAFPVTNATLDPGNTLAVGKTVSFQQGFCIPLLGGLPNVAITLLCLATEEDWLIDDFGGNVKLSGPHPCPKAAFAETVDIVVQEIPAGGQCRLRFAFRITLTCEGVA